MKRTPDHPVIPSPQPSGEAAYRPESSASMGDSAAPPGSTLLAPQASPSSLEKQGPLEPRDEIGEQEQLGGLRVVGVTHQFGSVVAAAEVSLRIRPGEVHGLLGPSGSGKSTLLRLVAGLEVLQAGSILIDDEIASSPVVHRPPEERSVGLVFQDFALFPHLDARRNVAFGMTNGTRKEKLRNADEWLARVGLADRTRAMPHTLSGGEQQRVALVRALARRPSVMLLDEPFSGLDRALREEIRGSTLELLRESGAATLWITHDPQEALAAGDQVSVIRRGRLLQTGTPEEVYHRPVSRSVAEAFGPVNHLKALATDGLVSLPWGMLGTTAAVGERFNGAVDVLIRPDALVLSRDTPVMEAGYCEATIYRVSMKGAMVTVTVEVDGVRFEAQDLARQGWRSGERVHLGLLSGGYQILPAG